MASCMRGCWGVFSEELRKLRRPAHLRGRTYRRARYSEKELSIEFENLIDEEDFNPRPRRILTETETELITQKRYNDLVEQQKKVDAEIDAQLSRREEDLRLEEEAYYEAKREAARVAKQARQMEENKASKEKDKRVRRGFLEDSSLSSWLSDDGVSVDSNDLDVEDFDAFLEKVKARSLGGSSPFTSPTSTSPNASWEDALAQGVEATKIAGKSLDALNGFSSSVDLVSVSER
ncbi:AP-1 complex-associated regulatory protein [Pocillopora verrucosa]|uniref:AP-1 complex-associated regulatory protein n=1 Tax=Pocillopora verrucosa TaxID=203993 RepID=UPI0027979C89|nr:AP-1 complex-associated regulatory protein-like [Pocillopora verrucosa]XP_058956031.1 AP-1 complex-associated regulatory protein-like [Pocillopora verrucosa]